MGVNITMSIKDYKFRSPNMHHYPELSTYQKHQLYDGFIGCGGLFLLSQMIKQMNFKKGDVVLDLGCGLGPASIFLAKHFEITIITVDLWHSPESLIDRMQKHKLLGKIIPLQLDITEVIPFAEHYFDVIFSMNALFMFGGSESFLSDLLNTLKSGGTFCLGSECFNQEPDKKATEMFNFDWHWDVWDECFAKYHFPQWWKSLFEKTDKLKVNYCQELEDSRILWEDVVVNYNEYYGSLPNDCAMIPQKKIAELIEYGMHSNTHLSLYVLSGVKK